MTIKPGLHAFIDESGVRGRSARSSDYFIMSAVVVRDTNFHLLSELLADLREKTGRQPGHHLSWKNVRGHSERLYLSTAVGTRTWVCCTIR